LREMKERGERHPGTKGQLRGKDILGFPKESPELKDLSISYKQSHIWQKIAELDQQQKTHKKIAELVGVKQPRIKKILLN